MSEAKIRDELAKNLSIFGMGLQLIDIEYYLPNARGTRSFVDILARDEEGRYVIIELKRSNKSAREAIHEILKYTEGLKENKSLKDSEMTAIIVSTEWHELFIPFSAFVSKTNSELLGFNLSIDSDFTPISAKPVIPVTYRNERMLSDLHMCYQYYSEENLSKGIKSVIDCYENKGVKDYVMVILRHTIFDNIDLQDSNSDNQESVFESHIFDEYIKDKQSLKFMIYTTSQCLEDEDYLAIIKNNRGLFEDFDEDELNELEDIEKTNYLYSEVVINSHPWPYKDHIEIGTPAKFSYDILESGWDVQDIIRRGALSNNELLADEVIMDELKGLDGKSRQAYKKSFQSFKQLKNSLKDISRCLHYNAVWLSGIKKAFEDIEERFGDKTEFIADVYIFNPSNTILTINAFIQSAIKFENTTQWIPHYYIDVVVGDLLCKYYGCLVEDEGNVQNPSLQDVFEEFYGGSISGYLLTHISGGFESRDCNMVTTYGMKYANFLCLYNESTERRESFYYDGFRYMASDAIHPHQGLHNFFKRRTNFCKEIVSFYNDHTGNGFFIT
ncbi:endonuclease NucS domain-containing protein [Shewanella sp. Arc9-LZ]|uniref:endonuclease NucS domain-containing protein n=1 Tax=Shewanella sp. Arc9-LZ TaxID=2698686 RepID=UPI00137BFC0F|nr:endonuclease NucS domain-containing protein [Shewanella sp. Arc9-LZ]QHS14674.1 DUF91 domain-containing protein [Shewanella sp. Arc9-LZ]